MCTVYSGQEKSHCNSRWVSFSILGRYVLIPSLSALTHPRLKCPCLVRNRLCIKAASFFKKRNLTKKKDWLSQDAFFSRWGGCSLLCLCRAHPRLARFYGRCQGKKMHWVFKMRRRTHLSNPQSPKLWLSRWNSKSTFKEPFLVPSPFRGTRWFLFSTDTNRF